jgi:hypothetical protein
MPGDNSSKWGQYWLHQYNSLRTEYKAIVGKYPESEDVMQQVYDVLGDIVSLAGCTPSHVGESEAWKAIVDHAEQDKQNLCKVLQGKRLFSALYGTYTITLSDLKKVLQSSVKGTKETSQTVPCDGFREQRRRKRSSNSEDGTQARNKKAAPQTVQPTKTQAAVATKNYYAPLKTIEMETQKEENESETAEVDKQRTTGRPPPIVLTTAINLIHLQTKLKELVKGNFEFRNTKSGTRIISREMSDYSVIRTYFDSKGLNYYTFYPKSEKPIKAVIRHLPTDTPAEDISNGLVDLGFDVVSVKQMTSTRSSEGERVQVNLPLFLITLIRNTKSPEIFRLNNLCHIAIKVEAYRAQNSLTQCYNCQQFGHIWANCRQPPRCMWCGGGHLHKDCPEKENNENSVPNCCNCSLKEGERPHPSNYRGCSHAKAETLRRRIQRTGQNELTGNRFSGSRVTPGQSFAAVLRGNTQQPQQQQLQPAERSGDQRRSQQNNQQTGQSVQAPSVNSSSLDDMFKVATIVQQIMTELNGAVSEENKIVAITKIVLNLMKQNGH